MGKKNTTKQGNAYRDRVADILRMTPRFSNVRTEERIGSQDVDIYYEERMSTGTHRVACECKDYKKPLTKSFIKSDIYLNYLPLIQNRHVDAVRVIAPHELNPNAKAYMDDIGFVFSTDREDQIFDWLDDDADHRPVAILAGYGMGKTSFAKRLACRSVERRIANRNLRIPILIPLAEISSEQGLEGLLGKILSAQNVLVDYHFELFMELNRRGRLLIILDGFDEMKHTMTWREFKHNFVQLNRLVEGNARIILLGRPSALLSDVEELFVLRGLRVTGERSFQIPGAPDYQQVELQRFSDEQALDFMTRYAEFRVTENAKSRGISAASDLDERLQLIQEDAELKDLIRRPVQARMLADLAIDSNVAWRSFTRFELYDEFIVRITEREVEKTTRLVFGENQRVRFVQLLAWWLWQRSSQSGFQIEEVPPKLILSFREDKADDFDGVRRDLVSGSILERKTGDHFYFPHRSFIEFLVAKHLLTHEWLSRDLSDVSDALTPEIDAFLRESGRHERIAEWALALNEIRAPVSARFMRLIAWSLNTGGQEHKVNIEHSATPRDLLVAYFSRIERDEPLNEAVNFLINAFNRATSDQTKLTCVLCMLFAKEASSGELRDRLTQLIAALVLGESLGELSRVSQIKAGSVIVNRDNPFVRILMLAFKGEFKPGSPNALLIGIDFSELFFSAVESLDPQWRMVDADQLLTFAFERVNFAELDAYVGSLSPSAKGGSILTFFRRFPNPSELVPVTTKPGRTDPRLTEKKEYD